MSLSPGIRLGPYEIVSPLGQGGMGAVYRATDTRLNRTVAIKAMHATGALDPDHVARFEREAQLLASLNHPNIAAIHGLETVEATTYLVLEFVDGRPLSEVLRDGPLPLDEALPVARQIADALAATHERGIIHRDLKPGNIMVTPDGQVKVLDFGLGKSLDSSGAAEATPYGQANSPTMTLAATQAGVILGTAGYMSPEQAKGRQADKRSDVWAFGCVLFEMLSGRRAFEGEDITETLAAIVRGEPDWAALPATTPPAIRTLIERCVIKNRADRLPDMSVVKFVLNEPAAPPSPAGGPLAGRRRVSLPLAVAMVAVGAVVTAAVILAVVAFGRPPATESPRAIQLQVLPPDGFASSGANGGWTLIAPDGSALLMTGSAGLWLRSLESGESTLIPDTAGATYPFWSADSQDIAFFRGGKLKRMAARGGPVVDICPAADPRGGSWNQNDVILFAPGLSTGLYQVSANGGTPAVVVGPTPGISGEFIRYPWFLPDGKHFLFQRSAPQESGFYLGSLDGTPARLLRPFTSSAVYAPPSGGEQMGRLLFLVNETTLMSQPFDLDTLQLAGAMSPVADGVTMAGQTGNGAFSVSAGSTLVYASVGGLTSQMMLFDRLGRQAASIGSPVNNPTAVLSKDGRQVMYVPAFRGVFLQQVTGGPPTQVAEGRVYFSVWSHDGRIAFSRNLGVRYDLFIKHLDGAAEEEPLGVSAMNAGVTDWSADDKWITYQATDNDTAADIWVLPLTGDRTPVAFLKTRDQEAFGRFSPDSRWMAYVQVVSGTPEVFVQSISASGSAVGIKFRISSAGSALGPVSWRSDGKELIYASVDRKVISVPVTLGATVETGSPQVLFPLPEGAKLLDMSGDAQRFLVAVPAGARANALTVIVNWQAGLKK